MVERVSRKVILAGTAGLCAVIGALATTAAGWPLIATTFWVVAMIAIGISQQAIGFETGWDARGAWNDWNDPEDGP